jgi:hypothetical protein
MRRACSAVARLRLCPDANETVLTLCLLTDRGDTGQSGGKAPFNAIAQEREQEPEEYVLRCEETKSQRVASNV